MTLIPNAMNETILNLFQASFKKWVVRSVLSHHLNNPKIFGMSYLRAHHIHLRMNVKKVKVLSY